jgi:hypothetical protein
VGAVSEGEIQMQIKSIHPVADLFPMMTEDELADLASDIKANGQLHPIIVDDAGQLIDGRNRKRACEIAGVDPWFEKLNGHDATALIISANIARRQMTKGAIAMVAAMAYPEAARVGRGQKASAKEAFQMVSMQKLSEARSVLRYAPELAGQVIASGTSLNDAYKIATDRKMAAASSEGQLAALRIQAPDLADQVSEERLTLAEAVAAFTERKREQDAREKSQRDTLLRLTSTGYTATLAWANEDFARSVRDRLADVDFRRDLMQSLRLKSSDIPNIAIGAAALTEVLLILTNGEV